MKPDIVLPISTPEGDFWARYTENGLAGIDFPGRRRAVRSHSTPALPKRVKQWHLQATQALKSVLSGRPFKSLPPLDWTEATPFQQKVWRVMLSIPMGKTLAYGGVASRIGNPSACRAVGSACGANPIPVLVPCHRILAGNGGLGGFSGGLQWKRRLLEREKVSFRE